MGGDLLLTIVWSHHENPDFDAVKTAIATLPDEKVERLDDYENGYDEGGPEGYRDILRSDLETLRQVWEDGGNRVAFSSRMSGLSYAVTGGISWGDSPTEEFDSWNRLIDAGVLEAGGFYDDSNAIAIPITEDH